MYLEGTLTSETNQKGFVMFTTQRGKKVIVDNAISNLRLMKEHLGFSFPFSLGETITLENVKVWYNENSEYLIWKIFYLSEF